MFVARDAESFDKIWMKLKMLNMLNQRWFKSSVFIWRTVLPHFSHAMLTGSRRFPCQAMKLTQKKLVWETDILEYWPSLVVHCRVVSRHRRICMQNESPSHVQPCRGQRFSVADACSIWPCAHHLHSYIIRAPCSIVGDVCWVCLNC